MEWTVKYHKEAKKFLKRLNEDRRKLVLSRIDELRECLEEGIFPIKRLDVKKLKGKWEGFFRLRVGDFRVIFRVDTSQKVIFVYHIHFRGKVY